MNKLYFGDNLDILREYVADESADLIYLDPPFNSRAHYNVLFKSSDSEGTAQAGAFRDTWKWGEEAAINFEETIHRGGAVARLMEALRSALSEADMLAYLSMMALRLAELKRVLKPNGSLYLHCDPTASHYLKILMDAVFGPERFRNEIIWQRTNSKGHAYTRFSSCHDVILAYQRGDKFTWNPIYFGHSENYLKSHYSNVEEETNRRYTLGDCLNPNPDRPNLTYEWHGHTKVWRWTKEKMQGFHDTGRLVYTKNGMPRYKRYLDEMKGTPATDVWTDIFPINSQAQERLGYPTQKPLALMERIIEASSNEGDVVLDPFCGCGTTVHAAQKLNRQWIGIDVAYYAIRIIKRRLDDIFGASASYDLLGLPRDYEQAAALAERDRYQFQWWANALVGVHEFKAMKKGADHGIDGEFLFLNGPGPAGKILTSVKSGKNIGVDDIRDFGRVLERDHAQLGLFISLRPPTGPMVTEAAKMGFSQTAHGRYPRLQIVCIKDWFEGQRPVMPPLANLDPASFATRHRIRKSKRPDPRQAQLPLVFEGGKKETSDAVHYLNPDVRPLRASTG